MLRMAGAGVVGRNRFIAPSASPYRTIAIAERRSQAAQ
jgi:hypothetical protein